MNMAVDEALLQNYSEDHLPILRLYRWKNSISLGRFSKLHKSVDLDALKEKKTGCVRRISGGGILVHGGDLSYTMILPKKYSEKKGVKESYRYLCEFLIRLYKKLGFEACFASELNMSCEKSNICLASNEPYDIIVDGKKMGGNAQRYTSKALFQHGTIPISIDEEYFKGLFLEDVALNGAQTLRKLKSRVKHSELSILLKEAFSETFDAQMVSSALLPSEQSSVEELMSQKYSQERWNLYAKQTSTKA